jgi:hypothetical protein
MDGSQNHCTIIKESITFTKHFSSRVCHDELSTVILFLYRFYFIHRGVHEWNKQSPKGYIIVLPMLTQGLLAMEILVRLTRLTS